MRFDIGELATDWLVSGRKTGDFVAKASHALSSALLTANTS